MDLRAEEKAHRDDTHHRTVLAVKGIQGVPSFGQVVAVAMDKDERRYHTDTADIGVAP